MGNFVRRRQREADAAKKAAYIEQYIPQVAIGIQHILDLGERDTSRLVNGLTDVLERTRKL